MLKTIRHKGLKKFYDKGDLSKIQPQQARKLRLILGLLKQAKIVTDMNFPGSDLYPLSGKLKDFWSVKVSGNWRVIFRIENGNVSERAHISYFIFCQVEGCQIS